MRELRQPAVHYGNHRPDPSRVGTEELGLGGRRREREQDDLDARRQRGRVDVDPQNAGALARATGR